MAVISGDPGDPAWLIAPFDDPDALVLLGGCGVRLGLLTNNPDDPTDLVDQVLGVLDGNLTEYVQLDERGARSVGYTHTFSGGRSSWGATKPGSGIVAVRYPAWQSQQDDIDEPTPGVDDSPRDEQPLRITSEG